MTRDIERELADFRSKIEQAKTELNRLEGEEKVLLKRLKDDHGLKSVEEAKKELLVLNRGIDKLDKELEEKLIYIEEKYEFG